MVDINDILMNNNLLPRSTVANPNFINQPQTRTSPYSVLTTPKSRFTALPAKEGSYTLGQTAQNQFANGMQQGGKNMYAKPAFVKPTQTSPTNVPPNQLGQNLLNFTTSPQGRGLARGLLEASGYSTTPVSFGQAIAQGMAYMNEADQTEASRKQQEFENKLLERQLELQEKEAAKTILNSIEKTLSIKENRTKDLQGTSNTAQCTKAILDNLN